MSVNHEKKITIEVTTKTIVKTVVILLLTAFVIYFKGVILIVLTSFIIMAAFRPIYLFLTVRKVPRGVAAALIVFLVIVIVGGLVTVITVLMARQLPPFIEQFPQMVSRIVEVLRSKIPVSEEYLNKDAVNNFLSRLSGELGSQLGDFGSLLWGTLLSTLGAIGAVLTVATTFVLSIYMLIDHDLILNKITMFFSKETRKQIKDVVGKVEYKIGAWLRGQLFLCLVIGIVTWLVLMLMDVKYAGALGVIAGILEILPVVGPFLSALPITIAGFSVGVWQGFGTIIAIIIIQQLENSVLVPLVMKRSVGLNPVVTLLAVIIGKEALNWYGALIAIPVTAIITVVLHEYLVLHGIIVEKETGENTR